MSDVALKSISVIIGFFFVLFGVLKVVPLFSQDLFQEMRSMFERGARVFPLQRFTGWRPAADTIRRLHGAMEMVCGIVLMVGCDNAADLANMILMMLLFFALYTCYALGEGLKEASHAIVLGLVLTCRFVIRLQTLQTNGRQEDSVDRAIIDKEFRKELRRKIIGLNASIKDAQEALNMNKQFEKESGLSEVKQRRSVGHNKKWAGDMK
ncbi:hypothetical protein Aperf_G00000080711 [Anoplocephala perfoliata]